MEVQENKELIEIALWLLDEYEELKLEQFKIFDGQQPYLSNNFIKLCEGIRKKICGFGSTDE